VALAIEEAERHLKGMYSSNEIHELRKEKAALERELAEWRRLGICPSDVAQSLQAARSATADR